MIRLLNISFIIIFSWIAPWRNQDLLAQQITHQGVPIYINGMNLPWNNFAWDFGVHPDWGVGFDTSFFDDAFADLAEAKVNCVRIWVHADGRASPNFDDHGYVTGLDDNHIDQMITVLELAQAHDLLVIFALWSHDMVIDRTDGAGTFAGIHESLITDPGKTQSYLDHALIPMVVALQAHCNLLAWEIISEPEWIMDVSGGRSYAKISKSNMIHFVGQIIQTIHNLGDDQVTIGSAFPNALEAHLKENYFHDLSFQNEGFHCDEVFLDFYSYHFFEWMPQTNSPFDNTAKIWNLEKPILISETPALTFSKDHDFLSPLDQLTAAHQNDFAGIMYWSYAAKDDFGTFEQVGDALNTFADQQSSNTNLDPKIDCDEPIEQNGFFICKPWPNPFKDELRFHFEYEQDRNVFLEIYDFTSGQIIFNQDISDPANELKAFILPWNNPINVEKLLVVRITSTIGDQESSYQFKMIRY